MRVPIGREVECEAVSAFLAAAASGPSALAVVGDPGMGKTTVGRYAVDLAREQGFELLSCRPTEAESSLSYAGLTDLLAHVDASGLDELPPPQRDALAVATLRIEAADPGPDERAIATGLAGLLKAAAARTPTLVIVDDVHWLDQPTLDALAFALRRWDGSPVGLLTCRRSDATRGAELADALTATWHRELGLAGLSLASLFHIIQAELDATLSRPVMSRITDVSRGNPYVAIELARSLIARGSTSPADLVVPDSFKSLHADRLGRLSDAAREALLAVACAVRPTAELISALGLTVGADEAEAAGVIRLAGARVEFEHPLLASATVELASGPDVRQTHARLFDASDDAEAKARHGALAKPGPDDGVAATLDAAVDSAQARGAPLSAAEFARMAVERTEDQASEAAWRRRVRLGELLHMTGATREAADLIDGLGTQCPPGPVRARGWLLMTEVSFQLSSAERAQVHARAALADAGDDVVLQARALLSLAVLSSDGDEKAIHAAMATRALSEGGVTDPTLLAWAECETVTAQFQRGRGLDREGLDRALRLERTGRAWRSGDQVAAVYPTLLKAADFHEEALAGLEELRAKAEDEGNDGLLPYVIGHIPMTLLRLGRADDAAAAAAEHLAMAEATGQESQRAQALYNVALVAAHHGDLAAAEEAARDMVAYAERESDSWIDMSASAVLGFVELSRERAADAVRWLGRWHNAIDALGVIDPGTSRFHGDHIEALALSGDLDEAARRTSELETLAANASRVSAAAVAERCRGLLAAAGGDQPAATEHLVRALELHEQCLVPFERARTLLLLGTVQRRAKRKKEAAATLARAAEAFTELGAAGWLARVEAESSRVAPRRQSTLELTVTERRVAELAASGLTNRQVAEQAFISPKTVEANLARAYRKLGISSRAELGSTMAALARADEGVTSK